MKFYQKYGSLTRPLYNIATFMRHEQDDPFNGFISPYLQSQFAGGDQADSQQGSGIVSQRLSWERGRIERIQANLDRSVKIVRDTDEYRLRLKLPSLSGSKTQGGIRYDPEGNLYTSWWRTVETRVEPDGRTVIATPPEQPYRVLSPAQHRRDVLTNLPRGQMVVELILAQVKGGIEDAIRQQEHILEAYKPGTEADEVTFARDVIEYTEGIMTRFILKRGVAKSDLIELATETGQWLENQNIYNPRDPRKRRILEKLLTVPLEDSEGRANFLVLLARVGAVHTTAVERLTVGGKTVGKFEANLQKLAFERENTRWRFRLVDEHLEAVAKFGPMKSPGQSTTEYLRNSIANALKVIANEHLASVKVKPYLRAARWVAINMVGCREDRKEINRKILGTEAADKLFASKCIKDLIEEGKLAEAAKRIQGCRRIIIRTLVEYEDIEGKAKA